MSIDSRLLTLTLLVVSAMAALSAEPSFREEISNVGKLTKMPEEESRKEEAKQVAVARRIIELRVKANVKGYEQTEKFQEGLRQFQNSLSESEKPIFSVKIPEQFEKRAAEGWNKNKESFSGFYEKVLKGDRQLEGKSEGELLQAMSVYSLKAYATNPRLWDEASKQTYIYPICDN